MLDKAELDLLRDALATLADGFATLPAFEQTVDHGLLARQHDAGAVGVARRAAGLGVDGREVSFTHEHLRPGVDQEHAQPVAAGMQVQP